MPNPYLKGNGVECPACTPRATKKQCPYCSGTGRVPKMTDQIVAEMVAQRAKEPTQ